MPRVTDHVMTAPKSNRNFIHWNALNQMRNAPPEKIEPKHVDQPNGNVQSLDKSGLMPKYALKKVFILGLYIMVNLHFLNSGIWTNSCISSENEIRGCRGGKEVGGRAGG